jgi:hypothetical protein
MCNAMAPPCENPATMIRFVECRARFRAGRALRDGLCGGVYPRSLRQAPIDSDDVVPGAHLVLMVTGARTGACGNTKRMTGMPSSATWHQRLEVVAVGARPCIR